MSRNSSRHPTEWPPMEWPASPSRIRQPSAYERFLIRLLVFAATVLLVGFAIWLYQPDHWGEPWLAWPLNVVFGLVFFALLGEWWYYWRIDLPEARSPKNHYTVDVFTTACPGEPPEMIVRTLRAMRKIRHPHTSYLCDEGDDPHLRQVCEELGVVHVTREKKVNAKAGNINNALHQSSGDICIILDPDHEPAPFMIDRLLGYFDDESIGFVQSVQAYRNQASSFVARGAAEMQYHFYGPIQMGMHGAGTPQAIGANCAFRREALESIGGHAAGLAEDMHTTMRLFAAGWKGAYVPEILTRGLVPQTLGAFYKQQIKWSCGVFDLFFQVLPNVFRSLSWKQRLHFLLCPLFFLQGWVFIIGALVPITCLLTGRIAWKITSDTFLSLGLPLLGLVLLIRMVAQRFLAEPSERGFHLTSGVLCAGSWWVFIVGNLCAFFRRKVPYLPTPKDDEPEDAWKISIPNIILAVLSLAAIPIGLSYDFSPYSGVMALFAAWNAVVLLIVVAASQQKTWLGFRRKLGVWAAPLKRVWLARPGAVVAGQLRRVHRGMLALLRERPLVFAGVIAAALGVILVINNREQRDLAMAWAHLVDDEKEVGGFYTGFYSPADFDDLAEFRSELGAAERLMDRSMDIASIYVAWGPESISGFPESTLEALVADGKVPMISWEPWTSTFPWAREQGLPLARDQEIFRNIADGAFDYYIVEFVEKLRDLEAPVLLRFGHEMDNPQYPWSEGGKLAPPDFVEAWRRIVAICNQHGASNVGFVYNPWRGEAIDPYYPGDDYVDWIGLTLLNYGKAARNGEWHSFDTLYGEFDGHLRKYDKPVMLAEFGSTSYGGDAEEWLADAFDRIHEDYPQIRAAVLFHSARDKNWATDWRPSPDAAGIDWTFLHDSGAREQVVRGFDRLRREHGKWRPAPEDDASSEASRPVDAPRPFLTGEPGSYELLVDGEPFYIRGVAYNPGHDWRDGGKILSRREIDKDFAAVKAMGANTIRRYSGGWEDYNLFNAAERADLKVIYGLWLPQDLDYSRESDMLDDLEEDFIELVTDLKDEPALLTWVIGNEVWGGFKHSFEKPHLTVVRHAYVRFVERLARRIREIDPGRPIMVACEHSEQLAGALADYVRLAPSVDMFGINSFYSQHLEHLPGLVGGFGGDKPYVVTEFGPDGYWHADYSPRSPGGFLVEPSAREKGGMFVARWKNLIEPNRGRNLGGVAYCWSERYEGSSTWFGMVERDGTPKPAYFAMQEAWTGSGTWPLGGAEIRGLKISKHVAAPGEAIAVKASFDGGGDSGPFRLSWKVMESNYEPAGADFEYLSPGGEELRMVLPEEEGRYWIHLNLTDNAGRSDEMAAEVWVVGDSEPEPEVASHPRETIFVGSR